MKPGRLALAKFPYGGMVGAKLRPVLLLSGPLGTTPEFLVAYITSIIPKGLLPTDMLLDPMLPEHSGTNLKTPSLLRLHKLATIHRTDIVRLTGQLSPAAWSMVETKLRLLLNL